MKAKHLTLAIAALIAAGGLWFAQYGWRTHVIQTPTIEVGLKTPRGSDCDPNSTASVPKASQMGPTSAPNSRATPGQRLNAPARLAPPVPNRHFTDFTPEQRVQFARQGHGPGG